SGTESDAASSSFSPCGRRWREAPDEGSASAETDPSAMLRIASTLSHKGRGEEPSLRINLRIRVPQNVLLHLAHGVARQLFHHEHPLRHLEFGEPPLEPL